MSVMSRRVMTGMGQSRQQGSVSLYLGQALTTHLGALMVPYWPLIFLLYRHFFLQF